MANLRANRITSTEVFETTGSVQFDGSGDYLSLSSNDGFDFGSGSFTIEAWVYPKTLTSDILFATSNTTGGFFFGRRNSGSYIGYGRLATAWDNSSGNDLIINQWNHVAVCRESNNNIRVFLNGIQSGPTQSLSTSYNLNTLTIGGTTSDYYVNGHISNLRVLKGTALYTKNFTPPTRELEVIPNTVLLCAQSKTQANQEATGKTITVNGNAVANELTPGLLTNVVKSGGSSAITGSVEFDGNDYLSLADNNDWDVVGDYTIEFWTKLNVSDASYTDVILATGTLAGSTGFQIGVYDKDLLVRVNSTQYYNVSVGRMSYDGWNHIAAVWNGSSFKVYLNGIQVHSGTAETISTSTSLIIGNQTDLDSNRYFNGFISNLRIIKGTALYTSNFIPPTRKLTKLPGTVLLCCQDNESVTAEATGKTITANGDPTATRFTPSVGSDDSVEFAGPTTINTENYFYLPTGPTEQRFPNFEGVAAASARGLFAGGYITPAYSNIIDSITISTLGNAADFGDLTVARRASASCSSAIRGLFGGGYSPAISNTIDFVTIASTGNASDFGDLTAAERSAASCSNSTRGLFAGGIITGGASTNAIDYVTIFSMGLAIDFGDVISAAEGMGGCSSTTRGLIGGGSTPTGTNVIQYVTISTTANALDFGDLTVARWVVASYSNSTRGLWSGGRTPTAQNVIDYVTIASTGNATDFGDLLNPKLEVSGCASSTRGVVAGGYVAPSNVNVIEYVTILSTGNSQDFGDLTAARAVSSCSNGHGGLG